MALILCIESSIDNCSVALFLDEELLSLREEKGTNLHASKLTLFIKECFEIQNFVKEHTHSKFKIQNLNAVCVAAGPGSYTSLRIGTSTAKGLCFSLNIPLLSVSTFESMVSSVQEQLLNTENEYVFCPMIDARRMEVYLAEYNNSVEMVSFPQPFIVTEDSLKERWGKKQDNTTLGLGLKRAFFGNGMPKCKELIQIYVPGAIFFDEIVPRAKWMGKKAANKFQSGEFENLATFEPDYLKEFRLNSKL